MIGALTFLGPLALELVGVLPASMRFDETGLTMQPGNMVIELKTPGASKGTALKAFMAEAPFLGATPVMLGDDLTDEHGFRAAAELGGFGVLVGPPRETAATFGLPDVSSVLAWLEAVEESA